MKIEGPIDHYGPFDEAGPIGPPSGRRLPERPAIKVEELQNLLAKLPEGSKIALPLKGSSLTILDDKGLYRGFVSLNKKEIHLWGKTE